MHECLLCKRDMKTATTIFGVIKEYQVIIKFNIDSYEVKDEE